MRALIKIVMITIFLTIAVSGCGNGAKEGVPFSIQANPPLVTGAYAGQAYIFSVTALSDDAGKDVIISASAEGCDVSVNPKAIKPGQGSKVTVVPDTTSVGKTITITIEGKRDGLIEITTATIEMGDTGDSGEGI